MIIAAVDRPVHRPWPLLASAGGAVLAAFLWAVPASAQDGEAPPDRVIATVNGEEIFMSEALRAIQALPPQVRQMPPEMLLPVIADQIAAGRLIAARGYDEGLQDDPEVQERVSEAERSIVQDVWLQRTIADRTTEDAVEEAYQKYVAENPPSEEVRARHILVETEDEAKALITQLDEGADFATLAQEHSTGPSGPNGGDLGYFGQGQMVQPFSDTAFSLAPGEVAAAPVETQFGWHVIKVEDKRLPEPPPLETVRGQIEQDLAQEIIQTVIAELREGAEIVVFGPDGEPLSPQ
ncbi:MAG: peptidylprolyl isomerase [Inquilinaceae bacterium]